MARRMTLSFEGIGQAMQLPGIREAVTGVADSIAARAGALYEAEGITAEVSVESGTRPTGRPYARVSSTADAAEFGTSRTARRRVLGRAAEQGETPT